VVRDSACGDALANLMTVVVSGDVPTKTVDIMSSTTLIVLLKKDATAIEALK